MSEPVRRLWVFYLDDMISFAGRVLEYTRGLEQSGFEADGLVRDAALRNLALIGEAATRIPTVVREKYDGIPWRMIIATRNRLIHGYLGLDDDTIWSIIRDDVPDLLVQLHVIKAELPDESTST